MFLRSFRLDKKQRIEEKWCGRWELNPHGPCSPADFLTVYGFRRPDKQVCGLDYPFTLLHNTGG
jgi:hypothetical protein